MEEKPELSHREKGTSFKLLAPVLALVVVIFSLWLIWTNWSGKTSDKSKNSRTDAGNQDVLAGANQLRPNQQRSEGKIDTPCYSFTVPRSVSISTQDGCALTLIYGSTPFNEINIKVQEGTRDGEDKVVYASTLEAYKQQLKTAGLTATTAEDYKLSDQQATKLSSSVGDGKRLNFLVLNKDTSRLSADGRHIGVLTLDFAFGTTEQTEVSDAVLKSWQWK